jgi:hypothetical protein
MWAGHFDFEIGEIVPFDRLHSLSTDSDFSRCE